MISSNRYSRVYTAEKTQMQEGRQTTDRQTDRQENKLNKICNSNNEATRDDKQRKEQKMTDDIKPQRRLKKGKLSEMNYKIIFTIIH